MNLREVVGSLIIVGLEGPELTALEQAWLKLIRPAGVILFRRNIEAAGQVRALLQSSSKLCNGPAFRCVDMEGGLVDRLRDLVARVPSAAEVAATQDNKLYREHGKLIGDEIAMLGFNTTFAPVLDLALPASAEVMRSRSTSPDPQHVIAYAGSFLAGLKRAHVLGCGKHFPGLGGGRLDSHHAMPEIDRGWQQIWEEDLLPYRKLRKDLPLVMISHASYPRVKSAKREVSGPASMSQYWVRDVLQRKIGYHGLVISDDMEMGGVLTQTSIEEASIAAIVAGTHLLEVCKEPALVLRTYEALLAEGERSSAFRKKLMLAAVHVKRQKIRLIREPVKEVPLDTADLDATRKRIALFTGDVKNAIECAQKRAKKRG